MKKMHIRRDDTVIVISGDDKGVKGKVIAVSPEEGKVIVEGANIVSKHQKYAATNEEKRGAYLREYTAITEYLNTH